MWATASCFFWMGQSALVTKFEGRIRIRFRTLELQFSRLAVEANEEAAAAVRNPHQLLEQQTFA